MTVIEVARKAAGMSQRRLADWARTQQSSVSEYESRRKSPTLAVVERLLDAADHDLVARPRVFFEYAEDPDVGRYWVPDRLWQVPIPDCYSRAWNAAASEQSNYRYAAPRVECRADCGHVHLDIYNNRGDLLETRHYSYQAE